MSIWIEIHCDNDLAPGCKTTMGDNPGVLTGNPRASMMDGLYSLERAARKKGWQKGRDHWTCPNCIKASGS